mmetsp:Transcript_15694/g.45307  ORF Transcript_15694/g.45307 Transcript_15694/m.45307 type:complete len:90 (+) Transcript_15694:1293-1562(+)
MSSADAVVGASLLQVLVVIVAWEPVLSDFDVELESQHTYVGDWARLGGEASSTRILSVHQVVLRRGLKSTLQWGWCGLSRENIPLDEFR